MSISKSGVQLETLDQWRQCAGPKRANQWVEGRSAMEVARAWLACAHASTPGEVVRVLLSHPDFGRIARWDAEPEVQLRFDLFTGEPRNTDLLVVAEDGTGLLLIAVEAKADEPFGENVGDALGAAVDRLVENPRSNGLERIVQLSESLFGPRRDGEVKLADIRYQLMTAVAGAIAESARRRISRTVVMIHEFVTDRTKDENHARNAVDLDAFVSRLTHCVVRGITAGTLLGPFSVPGAPLLTANSACYIGKARTQLRSRLQSLHP